MRHARPQAWLRRSIVAYFFWSVWRNAFLAGCSAGEASVLAAR